MSGPIDDTWTCLAMADDSRGLWARGTATGLEFRAGMWGSDVHARVDCAPGQAAAMLDAIDTMLGAIESRHCLDLVRWTYGMEVRVFRGDDRDADEGEELEG